jgi:hypothetical protein
MKKRISENTQLRYVNALGHDAAINILINLCKDKDLSLKIITLAKVALSDFDADLVADKVFRSLNNIQVEDLWDNSGKTRWGYREPTEVAYEIMGEVLSPFIQKMNEYRNLDMKTEEKEYCRGIIGGLLHYGVEGNNEFHDWVPDDPYSYAEEVLIEWKEHNKPTDIADIQAFYDSHFSHE